MARRRASPLNIYYRKLHMCAQLSNGTNSRIVLNDVESVKLLTRENKLNEPGRP